MDTKTNFYLIFISICFICLNACVNDLNEINKTLQIAEPSVEKGKNIEMFYSEDGNVKVKVTAPEITRIQNDNPYTEFNKGLHVDFFDDQLNITSTLTAKYGIRYEKEMKTIVRDSVLVINENNEQLSTEELVWDERNHTISSEKFVKIMTKTDILYGQGLEADETMTRYKILKPQGTIQIEKNNESPIKNF